MSRFRLNTALVMGSMVNGTIEKTVDEETGSAMRPTKLEGVYTQRPTPTPGCRMTFCREKARCHCTCKKCKTECAFRDVEERRDERGIVHLVHSDGTPVLSMPSDEYERLTAKINEMQGRGPVLTVDPLPPGTLVDPGVSPQGDT